MFHKHKPGKRCVPDDEPWVMMSAYYRKPTDIRVRISFSPAVAEHLEVKAGGMITWAGGSGQHAGWMQLETERYGNGYTVQKTNGRALMIEFTGRALGANNPHGGVKVTQDNMDLIMTVTPITLGSREKVVQFKAPEWALERW